MGNERKRRVIVFFTSNVEGANEWGRWWGFESGLFAIRADGKSVSVSETIVLPPDFERLVVWVNGEKLREEVEKANAQQLQGLSWSTRIQKVADLLEARAQQEVAAIKNQVEGADMLVAIHRWGPLSITGVMSVQYHTNLRGFERILLKLKEKVEAKNFATRFDEAWKYLSSAPRLPAFKHLSHRIIGHIFGPLAVDIQGIHQVEPFRRLEYARKIIESYRTRGDHPCLKLLADLCYLLCEREGLPSQSVTVETSLGKEDLPEVRTLDGSYERMPLSKILGSQADIDCAKKIRAICGLDDQWKPIGDSWLANFLRKLDEAVARNDPSQLVELAMSEGEKFLQRCQELHRCFDELERLLPEYAEPPEEAP